MAELFRPGTRQLRPSATPVDTYARPARSAAPVAPSNTNALMDLAKGLSSVRPSLDKYFQEELNSARLKAEAEGATAYAEGEINGIETNRAGWKEFIDRERQNDKINGTNNADTLAAMNPHFKRGYIRSHLDNLGMTLEDQLLLEWSQNPRVEDGQGNTINLQQSDDPQLLQAWARERMSQFMEENNVGNYDETSVAEAFLPHAQAALQGIAQRHSSFRLEERQREYGQAYSNNIQMIVGGIVATGDAQGGVLALQDRLNQAVTDGLNPKTANQLLVTAIATAAKDSGDASLLDLLDGIDTGNGPLGNVGWVKDVRSSTKLGIQQWEQSQHRYNVWLEEENRSKALRQTMGQAARALLSDPTTNIMTFQQDLIAQGNYSQALALGATQEQLLNRNASIRPDHLAITTLRGAIRSAKTEVERLQIEQQIVNGVATGKFDSSVATRLFDDLDQSERFNDVLSDPYVTGIQTDLERHINTLFANSDFPEDITRGSEAVSVFRQRLSAWIDETTQTNGQSPSVTAVQRQAEEIASAIYNSPRYTPRDNMMGEGRGEMRTAGQLQLSNQMPTNMTLPQMMDAQPGTLRFEPNILTDNDINTLFRDHQLRGEHSLLSELAQRQGGDPSTIMQALMGVPFDPFAPPTADEQTPSVQLEVTPEMAETIQSLVNQE